jgi:2-methylcitrate dehydratase PrpD
MDHMVRQAQPSTLVAASKSYNCCAAGLIFGRAAEEEFSDEVVRREDVVALRRKVVATVSGEIDEASVDVTAVLKNGQREHVFVEHAIGSLANPMRDQDLEAKFHGLSDPILGADKTSKLIEALWKLDKAPDVSAITALARP